MTTVAMIFGMLPLALAIGEGAEQRSPMAHAVIGGLITSTLLTLFVVPGRLHPARRPGPLVRPAPRRPPSRAHQARERRGPGAGGPARGESRLTAGGRPVYSAS